MGHAEIKVVVVVAALVACASAAPAVLGMMWGFDGHEIAAGIAERNLSAAAYARMDKLLGSGGMVEASTWADQVRSQPAYSWSGSLHYVNPKHSPPASCSWNYERDCVNDFCVVSAITNFTDQLAGRTPTSSETDALRFLIHFVQDLHQPMHVCGIYTGGNDFDVKFYGKSTNMHSLWDSGMLLRTMDELGMDADEFLERIVERLETEWAQEALQWTRCSDPSTSVCPSEWANEVEKINCSSAWVDVDEGDNLTDDYYDANKDVVEKLIAKAAVRLSAILNEVLPQ